MALNDCIQNCDQVSAIFLEQDQLKEENLENLKECIRIAHICSLLCRNTAFVIIQEETIGANELLIEGSKICIKCAEESGKFNLRICQNCKKSCERRVDVCKQSTSIFVKKTVVSQR